MPTFRLEPTPEYMSSSHWQSSTIGAQACWVLADDETAARWAVTMATIIATTGDKSDDRPLMPWRHEWLANCTLDPSREGIVGPGHVLDADGSSHEISEY